jgi:ubiquinone/menaquinone biosynthesis C-methylase UbiE
MPLAILGEETMPHVCPWWGGYFIDNRLRSLLHDPEKIVGPYVRPGMTVMDVGCGMGLFSIAMAKLVGDQGRIIAVDLQQKMLDVLKRRAERAGVAARIETHNCDQNRLGVDVQADLALAFMMVHEVPDQRRLLSEIHACLKAGGKLLVAEPKIHVSGWAFQQTVATAEELGLKVVDEPRVRWCRAVVLAKL